MCEVLCQEELGGGNLGRIGRKWKGCCEAGNVSVVYGVRSGGNLMGVLDVRWM